MFSAPVRSVARRKGLATAVVLTLALGIGANAAIFSAVDAILLKPLPYPAADRLVAVYEANLSRRQSTSLVAPVRIEEWNRLNRSLEGLAGSYFENMTDTTGTLPERVEVMRTSPRFFSVLGTPVSLGRTPAPAEEVFGGPQVVVLSDGFWRKRFDGDPSAVGRSLMLGGRSRTIIGVMPPSFRYPAATTEMWIPAQAWQGLLTARQARFYAAIARLRPGVTPAQAEADLAAIEARLAEQFPATDRGWTARVEPLKEEKIAGVRRSLWLLFGAVVLVLLAACGNVACLLLADATRREHELAVRFALGASRAAIIRQLLGEGLVLSSAGAALGLLIARWGTEVFRSLAKQMPRVGEIRMDWRLVIFTFAIGTLTTVFFALAPALHATRRDVAVRLARTGRATIGPHQRLQRLLVTGQVALAIVLLVGAGLLIRSFARLQQVSAGFDPNHVLTFRLSSEWAERTEVVAGRQSSVLQRLSTIPGVVAASLGENLPASIDYPPMEFHIKGRDPDEHTFAHARQVSGGYFQTLRIPILQGETCRDDPNAKLFSKVLVTRTFANRFFPGENPVGHSITSLGSSTVTADIIGVVGDAREAGLQNDPPVLIYACGLTPYWPDVHYLVRTDPSRGVTMTAVRDAMHQIEPNRAIYSAQTLPEALSESLSGPRLNTLLLTSFALTALVLAAIGLYGTLAQYVSARTREIGLRMALGAQEARVLAQVARHGAGVTAMGIVLGQAGSLALAKLMTTLVYGVPVRDPLTFALVPLVLILVAAAATAVPARRATRIDPIRALREE